MARLGEAIEFPMTRRRFWLVGEQNIETRFGIQFDNQFHGEWCFHQRLTANHSSSCDSKINGLAKLPGR